MTAPTSIELRSDNAAGVAPEILAAVAAANVGGAMAYGGDPWSAALQELVGSVFEHEAWVFPVITGTAANSLALAALCPPWGAVLAHETAHILRSECGATSMFSGGAVMLGLPGAGSLVAPGALSSFLAATAWGDNHVSQPAVLSLTNPTDRGAVYSPAAVAELSAIARSHGLRVHMDGARLANAVATLGCTPAELTWKAGVDAFSLGAMKNGALSTDAIVTFDRSVAEQLVYRTKRAGHVASKMRYQSAQLSAYLTDGNWLRYARNANERLAQLVTGLRALGVDVVNQPEVNMAFVAADDALADRLTEAGLCFYRMGGGVIRLVTSFATTAEEIDDAVVRWGKAL